MLLRLIKNRKKKRRWIRPEDYTFIQSFNPKELGVNK